MSQEERGDEGLGRADDGFSHEESGFGGFGTGLLGDVEGCHAFGIFVADMGSGGDEDPEDVVVVGLGGVVQGCAAVCIEGVHRCPGVKEVTDDVRPAPSL